MDTLHNTLSKDERLYCKKDIADLLASGKFTGGFPLRFCCRIGTGAGHSRIMVSVPKKMFKRAVKRNLLKRRIRESYRLQKSLLQGLEADILFIYNTKEVLPSEQIYALVGDYLRQVAQKAAAESAKKEQA